MPYRSPVLVQCRPCSNRTISPTRQVHSSKPAAFCCSGRVWQTDGQKQTSYHYTDPPLHTMQAVPINIYRAITQSTLAGSCPAWACRSWRERVSAIACTRPRRWGHPRTHSQTHPSIASQWMNQSIHELVSQSVDRYKSIRPSIKNPTNWVPVTAGIDAVQMMLMQRYLRILKTVDLDSDSASLSALLLLSSGSTKSGSLCNIIFFYK